MSRQKLQSKGLHIAPRVRVYQRVSTTTVTRWHWQTIVPLVLAMIVGIGFGSTLVWQSKFSEADKSAQVPPTQFLPRSEDSRSQTQKTIPVELGEPIVVANLLPLLIEENRHEPTAEELHNLQRKDTLRAYLATKKSPFAEDDATLEAFLDSKNMKLMLAISFVESTLGRSCYYHNCSGIGGTPPNLRKYDGYADWVRDFDSLLERRYKGYDVEDFIGVYVQPGSPNWVNGVKQILSELKRQGIE